ncbi:MAG: MMPL family transporter [Candidatus Dormiibacterota bacterium]
MVFRRLGEFATRFRYPIIGAWVLAAVLLNIFIPQLEEVVKRDATPFLPASADVMQAYKVMGEKFAGSDAGGYAILVLENKDGISQTDRDYYAMVVGRLNQHPDRVAFVQDYISHPEFKSAVESKDGKALYIPVGLKAAVGTPSADGDAFFLRDLVKQDRPADLTTYVTGDTAIIADFQKSIESSVSQTTVITLILLIVILLVIYRSPVTPLIPLTTIVLAILVVRPIVALLGLHYIKVASFTETFLLAIVFGAGTDYCIFLISRFKEQMSRGEDKPKALKTATRRVGEAIATAAATVVIGGLAMTQANVSLFNTTGPAIAVSVAITLVAGLTLTPALIAIGGKRFFWPQKIENEKSSRFWSGASRLIVSRPRQVLVMALIPLLALAGLYPLMKLTYDERTPQPQGNESIQGLYTLDHHYTAGEILPDYILVQSDHDLRNPQDLALLDSVTKSETRVPGVTSVRSFTQPGGDRIPQASIPYQAGQVGQGLQQARDQLQAGSGGVQQLKDGSGQVANGAGQVAGGAQQAQNSVDPFIAGLQQENSGLGQAVSGSASAQAGSAQLRDGAKQLSAGLDASIGGVQLATEHLNTALILLNTDPTCAISVNCATAKAHVQGVYDAETNQLLPGLRGMKAGADKIATGNGSLADGLGQLHAGLVQAQAGVQQLEAGEQTFKDKLGQLAGGASQVSGGASQVSGGVGQIASGTEQLKTGLGQAADYLNSVAANGSDSFFIPPDQLNNPQLALARYYFISSDGTTARIVVLGKDDPFSTAAMDRVQKEKSAASTTLSGTRLGSAHVLAAGFAPQNDNLRTLFTRDFLVVAIAVLVGVLLVLILLLRSLVAPVYLLASVLVSYAAAMGFTTVVWQYLLHKGAIDWTVPIFAFVMLVAVGADYNIFLMSRVREEVLADPKEGIGRAIRRTGAIITSAGIIFAGTFAAMVTSPVLNIAETGFAITFGLLLDTFVVRSFVVPAVAVLLGKWNWWPHFGMSRARVEALEATGGSAKAGGRPRMQPAK